VRGEEEEPDSQLARQAAAGDRASFARLAERHYARVHALAWRWSGARGDAEDIAQETMVKMASAVRGFRGESAFSTWLYRIAYRAAVDHLRARDRLTPLGEAQLQAFVEDGEPQLNDELWRAVRTLPERLRDSVLLVYGEEMSHAQAAAVMGCSEKTVSWNLHEARKRLRKMLEAV
jgi:RNA polymerase sigma-70 factor (ECF subfamily)